MLGARKIDCVWKEASDVGAGGEGARVAELSPKVDPQQASQRGEGIGGRDGDDEGWRDAIGEMVMMKDGWRDAIGVMGG